jgi:hypothetical protein
MLKTIELFVRDEDVRGFDPGDHFTKVTLRGNSGHVVLENRILERIGAIQTVEAVRAEVGCAPDLAPLGEPADIIKNRRDALQSMADHYQEKHRETEQGTKFDAAVLKALTELEERFG